MVQVEGDIDWDNMTYREYSKLCNSRVNIEHTIARTLMKFEDDTGLMVDSIHMYREFVPILGTDRTIREPNPDNISIQIRVPMRIIFEDDTD